MDKDWILQKKETRRIFANATWVPLRASREEKQGTAKVTEIGYVSYHGTNATAASR